MFGDPKTNSNGWKKTSFGNLITDIRYGTSIKCSSEKKGIPVLRIPNVINGAIDLTDLKYAEIEYKDVRKLVLTEGDLLFVRTNGNRENVGRSAVYCEKDGIFVFASYLIRARLSDNLDPIFANTYLMLPYAREQLFKNARTSAGQYNINTNGLKAIQFIVPPVNLQRKFATIVHKINYLTVQQKKSQQEIDNLFNLLLERAIGGKKIC